MIRIIYTSFTFIELPLLLVPKTFLKILCFPPLPLPPLPFPPASSKNSNLGLHFPFTCSLLHTYTASWVTPSINFPQTKPFYSEPAPDPAVPNFVNMQTRIPNIGSTARPRSLYLLPRGSGWALCRRAQGPFIVDRLEPLGALTQVTEGCVTYAEVWELAVSTDALSPQVIRCSTSWFFLHSGGTFTWSDFYSIYVNTDFMWSLLLADHASSSAVKLKILSLCHPRRPLRESVFL